LRHPAPTAPAGDAAIKGNAMGRFSMAAIVGFIALGSGAVALTAGAAGDADASFRSAGWVARPTASLGRGPLKVGNSEGGVAALLYAGPSPGKDDDRSLLPGLGSVLAVG
jgi:hypothetical protein